MTGIRAMSWHDALSAAQASTRNVQNGYLATIPSSSELDFLNALVPANQYSWLGGVDAASEGAWEWVTGEAFSFTNWFPGEPKDLHGEDYLVGWWWNDHQLNDLPGDSWQSPNSFVVEYDAPSPLPPPAAFPLLVAAIGGLGIASGRRHTA